MKTPLLVLCLLATTVSAQQPAVSQSAAAQPAPSTRRLVGDGPPQHPADPRMVATAKQIEDLIAQDDANVAAGKATIGDPLLLQGPYRATMEWRNTAQKSINVHTT